MVEMVQDGVVLGIRTANAGYFAQDDNVKAKAKEEADSFASLRNDNVKAKAKAKEEADSFASLRNDLSG